MSDDSTRDEYERMRRVTDMSLSAHSFLRDRYRRRQRFGTLLVMTLSIVATGFAFVSTDTEATVTSTTIRLPTLLGLLTMLIFFLALTELVLDWRGRASAHDDATRRLFDLKAQMRTATLSQDAIDAEVAALAVNYEQTMATIIRIPERQFLSMKSKHNRKIAVSKLIDTHRGAPVPYLRLLAVLGGLRTGASGQDPEGEPDEATAETPVP